MIQNISSFALEIPFRMAFKHHQAERKTTLSVWVEVDDGRLTGYGEACPRTYVTGEDLNSVQAFLNTWKKEWQEKIQTLADVDQWQHDHASVIDKNPSAWCAVELALLDLLAKRAGYSVENLLSWPQVQGDFDYTAVLGEASDATFKKQLAQYQHMGFTDYKLKLSGERLHDQKRTEALVRAGAKRFRVDANNLWKSPKAALEHLHALYKIFPLFGVEEPLQPAGRFGELKNLAHTLQAPIIADESCVKLADLKQMDEAHWIVNLRVSKMGGLLRSRDVIHQAKKQGIPLIIGAQVGESSLLTRAALSLFCYCKIHYPQQVLGQEGAFGDYLLQEDVVTQPLKFGPKGRLNYAPVSATGWGLTPLLSPEIKRPLIGLGDNM